ncbi:VUT family protein [Exiguobacterium sp. RIT452]|uniref:queuosine precursor transporter n=1 Tax=Exiguobacterium sp. RIT452 TaxID=2315552 RepID=UPI000E72508F|nr:queuosine precursor transporter [Exiguobacterium sp. RIT452]RJP00297.1 VUT family protein [Exiguobacterium sp. RIT452]
MNEWLWFPSILITMGLLLLSYRLFGKTGLLMWIAIATIIANIQVTQQVELYSYIFTLGNVVYGSCYLATDILNEKYGKKVARQGVYMGFFSLITTTLLMQYSLLYTPLNDALADDMSNSLHLLFGLLPWIAFGSLSAYLVSQLFDVFIYSKIRQKTGEKKLWLRTTGSTVLSQLIDTLTFCAIAFHNLPFEIWWQIFVTTYLAKFVIAWVATPFMYVAKRIHPTPPAKDTAA